MPDYPSWYTAGQTKGVSGTWSGNMSDQAAAYDKLNDEQRKAIALKNLSTVKDVGVDAASQIPLALIPEGGMGLTALRALGSLISGYGTDRVLNGGDGKTPGDSAADALVNTGIGMAVPNVLANEVKYNPNTAMGTGSKAVALRALDLLNPANYESVPRTVPVNTTQGTKLIPKNVGTMLDQWLFKATNGKINTDPRTILNLLGFGANAGFDTTVNKHQ